jgi:hypothetical protein
MNDTDPRAEKVQTAIFRAMSPTRRLAVAAGWSTALRDMTRATLRKQFPGATEDELRRRFAERWLGEELAAKAYGQPLVNG